MSTSPLSLGQLLPLLLLLLLAKPDRQPATPPLSSPTISALLFCRATLVFHLHIQADTFLYISNRALCQTPIFSVRPIHIAIVYIFETDRLQIRLLSLSMLLFYFPAHATASQSDFGFSQSFVLQFTQSNLSFESVSFLISLHN